MKHTKGNFKVEKYPHCNAVEVNEAHTICTDQFCHAEKEQDNKLANMELIAEAFNVTNETGFTPRQLADQKAELLEACNKALEVIRFQAGDGWESIPDVKDIKEAIQKATP